MEDVAFTGTASVTLATGVCRTVRLGCMLRCSSPDVWRIGCCSKKIKNKKNKGEVIDQGPFHRSVFSGAKTDHLTFRPGSECEY